MGQIISTMSFSGLSGGVPRPSPLPNTFSFRIKHLHANHASGASKTIAKMLFLPAGPSFIHHHRLGIPPGIPRGTLRGPPQGNPRGHPRGHLGGTSTGNFQGTHHCWCGVWWRFFWGWFGVVRTLFWTHLGMLWKGHLGKPN